METPLSTRRVTRSQTAAASQKSKKQDESRRQALFDITNDSPIVGLAREKTPNSASVRKICVTDKRTPCSGETLLRCQVKNLLQKVDEEKTEDMNGKNRGDLVAPTPVNTPQIPTVNEQVESLTQGDQSGHENLPNRALLFDSPAKSELSDNSSIISSARTYQSSETLKTHKTEASPETEDDRPSVWSTQVNSSTQKEEQEEEYQGEEGEWFNELCEGMNKMSVMDDSKEGKNVNLPEFAGTHTRFVYDSDGEIEDKVMVFRGLPAPEGKHMRFHYEDEEL